MKRYLAVAGFAFLGGASREGVELLWPVSDHWLWTTMLINIIGAFLLTLVNFWAAERLPLPSEVILGLGTGFVGAFTTFSSFSLEMVKLLLRHFIGSAMLYVTLSLVGGLCAAFAGQMLAKWLMARAQRGGER
ncbi:putative fluoride ion transporter CrcB 2 [Furfurilactobacillus curtus]|uniref:Fluoride-specific ion channel FluC n=1 Tax=Furfurilactobacillus curtus TaxID=1746200 RepID=A0ABQ5JME2_9LACO